MIELPTPETDALFWRNGYPVEVDSSKAMQLCEKLEQERDWITEKFKLLEGCFKRAERERDEAQRELEMWKFERDEAMEHAACYRLEANKLIMMGIELREQNAKLRDIAERAIIPLECDGVPWGAKLRAELDRLKEGRG